MGEVFRATDEQLGRPVAVKLMLPSDRDPRAAERFHREARAAAVLNDPHLVAVYDFGQQDDQFFLVMELVEGRTVAAELAEQGPLPKDRAVDIVEQSAAGLAVAHRQDVIHRDVKPGNLLLTPDGTVKVADFGIAHLPGDGSTTLTATGQIIGSTHYLAPERAQGRRAGKESDVYALGCVLYQLVTGQPPFTAEHPTAILYQHVDTPPAPPSAIRPELGGPFEIMLLRMLAKDPADRPSAAEIAGGALRALPADTDRPTVAVAGGDIADRHPDAPAPVPAIVEAGAAASPPEGPHRTRKKALLAGAIAIVATAAAVLTGVLLDGDGTRLPATTDVGPRPGVVPDTQGSTTTDPSTTGSADPGAANQPTRSTSSQPSPDASQQGSPTPGRPSSGTPSQGTSSPGAPPEDTPTPSASPSDTSSPNSPSSTPPTDDPPTSSPSAGTPPPDAQNRGTPTPKD